MLGYEIMIYNFNFFTYNKTSTSKMSTFEFMTFRLDNKIIELTVFNCIHPFLGTVW
jgi:hypothetical protein